MKELSEGQEKMLQRITKFTFREKVFVAIMLTWIWAGFLAWLYKYIVGEHVVALNSNVPWGVDIAGFIFFGGVSFSGAVISSIVRLVDAEWGEPITRIAEIITIGALTAGGLNIFFSVIRMPRAMFELPVMMRLHSGLPWDFIVINLYFAGAVIYLYSTSVPDLALLRDRLKGQVHPWRHRLWSVLAAGYTGTEQQKSRLRKSVKTMVLIILPIGAMFHTVISWISATTLRPGWHSTIFGPYYLSAAVWSGVAIIIVVMWFYRRIYGLEESITETQFLYLGYLLFITTLVYAYFTLNEYFVASYQWTMHERGLMSQLYFGQYAPVFWLAIAAMILPAFLVALPWTRNPTGITVAAFSTLLAAWLKRWIIVVPSISYSWLTEKFAAYPVNLWEYVNHSSTFAVMILVIFLLTKLLPVVPIEEVD